MLTQSHMGVTIWLQQEAETCSILSIWTGESRWQTTDPEEFTFRWESCHQQLPQVTTEMSSVAFPLSVFFCAMKEYRAWWKSGIFPLCKLFRTEKFNQSSQCKMVHTFFIILIISTRISTVVRLWNLLPYPHSDVVSGQVSSLVCTGNCPKSHLCEDLQYG